MKPTPLPPLDLAALAAKLTLPHVENAPLDPENRRTYFQALQSADHGNLEPLTSLWLRRLDTGL